MAKLPNLNMTGNWTFTLGLGTTGVRVPVTIQDTNGALTGSGTVPVLSCPITITGTRRVAAVTMVWTLDSVCQNESLTLTGVTGTKAASGIFVTNFTRIPGGTWTATRTS